MKLTTFLLLISLIQVSAASFGQKVTLKANGITLNNIFYQIRKQTGYSVLVDGSNFRTNKKVDVNFSATPLETVLDELLKDTEFGYEIEDKNILVERKEKSFTDRIVERLQSIDVSGKVIDADGRPIPGANVKVKGTKISVSTDNEGSFLLKGVDENAILVISYTGYETKEFKAEKRIGTIRLDISLNPLDEVQVIAYGTTTRRLSTGNISTVTAKDIANQPVSNPLLALQGRVPGLVVVQNSGMPGGGITVRIQGRNSIRNGNDPLYVIDGIPLLSQLPRISSIESSTLGESGPGATDSQNGTTAGNPLSFINPDDIESIDVLKDADATAIYGSRASNGAILITTKKGKTGKMSLNANVRNGWSWMPNRLDVMDTRQYLDMRYEAYRNDGIDWKAASVTANDLKVWDTTRYTNWQKELLSGVTQTLNATASISGGSGTIDYLISGTYGKDGIPFPGDFGSERFSVAFNVGGKSTNQRLSTRFSGSFMNHRNKLPLGDPTSNAIFMQPNAPAPYNPDGSINWAPNSDGASTFTLNPYISLLTDMRLATNSFIGNWQIGYKILKNLEFSNSLGFTLNQADLFNKTPTSAIRPEWRSTSSSSYTPNSALFGDRNLNSLILEPKISYSTNIFDGKLDALLGGTVLQNRSTATSIIGQTFPSDERLEHIGSAATITATTSTQTQYKYAAFFGRLNYNHRSQYLLNISGRRDGSSRFGKNNQFNNFWAVGAAWVFSENEFVKGLIPGLSFGKLRASYGTAGNDQIGDFMFLSLYSTVGAPVPFQGVSSLTPSGLPNPDLQWEEVKKISLGIDLGFFNDRILLNSSYSSNTSSNQLGSILLPSMVGRASYVGNFPGTVRNTTWEFTMNSRNVKSRSFEWNSSINLTVPKNVLVKFPNLATSSYSTEYVIGQSLDITFLYRFAGVDPLTGLYQFFDRHGELTSNPNFSLDRIALDLSPKLYGGIQNDFQFKGFKLGLFIQFVKQSGMAPLFGSASATATPGAYVQGSSNQPITALKRWQNVGDVSVVKKFRSATNDPNVSLAKYSTAGFTDASFARLKNASISWEVPKSWLRKLDFQSAVISANVQNLWTISGFKGLNPEKPIAVPSLPPMRTMVIGVQLGL